MANALIIGISGQDGAYLTRLLLDKGYRVVGTSRDHESGGFHNLKALGVFDQVTLRSMATSDFRSVYKVMSEFDFDEIYNLAGQSSVGLSFEQPVETHESISIAALNILECLRMVAPKARLYNAGSSECFGDQSQPASVSTPFLPRSPYATAKASAFWTVHNYREAYGLHCCSGILFNHESPLRSRRFVTAKIVDTAVRIHAGSGETLYLGNLDVHRDWGWAPEYVDAMWRMLQTDEPRDHVICTGQSHSLHEFLKETFAALDMDWQEHVQVDDQFIRPSDIRLSQGDPSAAEAHLGWRAQVGFAELVARLVSVAQERLKDAAR